ncbi:hypothetical protein MTQ01_02280 [Streptomyces sp. XM4193]|uniref:hypothetical protein n=1 Tax=Streptomyces sp. XM4193 TaxID=2929782 RepID=UPI001FFC2189|nr:hypothetical protein [Streptomyces sp. XM4193]MCK1794869.1 hypothetical protein [Streptomyces sp. XM4193]
MVAVKAYAVGVVAGAMVLVAGPAAQAASPGPPPSAPSSSRAPDAGDGAFFPVPEFPFAVPPGLTPPPPVDPVPDGETYEQGELPPGGDGTGTPTPPPSSGDEPQTTGPTPEPSEPRTRSGRPADAGDAPPPGALHAPEAPSTADTPAFAEDSNDGAEDTRAEESLALRGGEPLLPVLPLGAGLASLGLGLAALGYRLRRNA